MEKTVFMNLCMVTDGKRVLLQNRLKKDWPGLVFPGGHVEEGEAFADSVIREIYEETGLTVSRPRLCGIKDWCENGVRYAVLCYRAESFCGELRSSPEGEVLWEDMDRLAELPLSQDMKDTIIICCGEDASELFYRKDGMEWKSELK